MQCVSITLEVINVNVKKDMNVSRKQNHASRKVSFSTMYSYVADNHSCLLIGGYQKIFSMDNITKTYCQLISFSEVLTPFYERTNVRIASLAAVVFLALMMIACCCYCCKR
jgi:hypothetical protein